MTKPVDLDQLMELADALECINDPRVQGRVSHSLGEVLVMSICAILCGAEGIYEIELFGKAKESWLKKFLELPYGVPSHDTIARVLLLVNPNELEIIFREWVRDVLGGQKDLKTISLDGKCSNGTERGFNTASRPLHIVSAYSHEHGLTLSQAEAKSSGLAESDAAIICLKSLDIKGVTVLADAGLATNKVVEQICAQKGSYLVPVKRNHANSFAELNDAFSTKKGEKTSQKEKGHGRKEERACEVLPTEGFSKRFKAKWPNVKTAFAVTRSREERDKRFFLQKTGSDGKQYYEKNTGEIKRSEETTYYVSSLKLNADEALVEIRKHWHIENKVHWILDVAFREDDCMVRAKKLAKNLSLIRKIALNLIRSSKTTGSVRGRMKKAAWSNDFMEHLLRNSV